MECVAEVVARKYIDALNKGDAKTILSLFADDAQVIYPGGGRIGGSYVGKEAIGKLYKPKGCEELSEYQTTVTSTVSRGGIVAMEFQTRIAGKGKSGKGVFSTFGTLFMEICENRIERLSIYVTEPAPLKIGGVNLSEELSVADMGMLSAVAWAVV